MATSTGMRAFLGLAFLGAVMAGCSAPTQSGGDTQSTDASDITANADVPVSMDVPGGIDAGTPCTSNTMCAATEYCEGAGCGTPGACIARPATCSGVVDPYCGCDGVTYANSCVAARAGARVASAGACGGADGGGIDAAHDARGDTSVDAHPGPCLSSSDCASGSACCVPTGICYSSSCLSCCMPAPGTCVTNAACTTSQFCGGTGCGTTGTCTAKPTFCSTIINQVCGCDGVTYTNSCVANRAGVRVASTGACITARDAGVNRCVGVICRLGTTCCPSTGACYATTCTSCCAP